MLETLNQQLQQVLPSAARRITARPENPRIQLALLQGDYPQGELSAEEVRYCMDNPLYWVFCWASVQVLARLLPGRPDWVRGKRVLDFGCGSGVVAIAAALAGAREVIACDIDPLALEATQLNADLNGVALTLADDYEGVDGRLDLITAADVLYDHSNLHWLQRFSERSRRVLVADSRVKNFQHDQYREIERHASCTIPDLDESAEFRSVGVYLAG